jgi:adenylate kinase family enzyme
MINRIHILGTSGSGKSFLAKKLSTILDIEHYDLDDFFFIRKYDKKRSKVARKKLLDNLAKKRKWIVEGVYASWVDSSIKRSDMVILIDTPFRVVAWRIFHRFL